MPLFYLSCEKMEDTYDKYKGAGKSRYVGKCTNLKLEAGWKRFKLNWTNSLDATIKEIKIKWESTDVKDSVIITPDKTSYETEAIFENKNYEFSIYALDQQGNHSLKTNAYGRPFTYDHEFIRNFGRVEKKYFFIDNKLIIFWDTPTEGMYDRKLIYTDKLGNEVETELTEDLLIANNGILEIEDIDISKEVKIKRSASIDECYDDIVFEPYVLDENYKNFNSDFVAYIKGYYNIETINSDFVNNIEILNINLNLISLSDILYFPNLTKVVLGGERYKHEDYIYDCPAMLDDTEKSIYALNIINEYKNTEVHIYNDFYGISSELPFANQHGNPSLPDVNILNNSSWTIESSTEEDEYDSHPEYLLDNDQGTVWTPLPVESSQRTHELTIDMKSGENVNGIFIKHPIEEMVYSSEYFAESVLIEVSTDGQNWSDVYTSRTKNLNSGRGETTVFEFPETHNIQYLKITVMDRISYRNNTFLADIVVFN